MIEKDAQELGFKLSRVYKHDHYTTNRYTHLDGCLEVEFTYANNVLVSHDLTIQEINCMPITKEKLKNITEILVNA